MGDFFQNGVITTLHNLAQRPVEELEAELVQFSAAQPMALVLPSLYSELEGPALAAILKKLAQVPYINEIVIGLDRATEDEYRHALEYFSDLPQKHRVSWNDGPRMQHLESLLDEHHLAPGALGKGRNVWYCFGNVLAWGESEVVALHDCDILTYDRELPARLFYPTAHPGFSYHFCKGYYSRIADGRINGRVCRLLVTPLIRALKRILGSIPYLEFLDGFRYPLAGEFSLRMDVLHDLRIPSDWGLEIGVLSELQRNYSVNRVCQVDISDAYDHKHQPLSAENAEKGLSKMSLDIAKAVFRKLATTGEVLSIETIRTAKATYYRMALDMVGVYNDVSVMNGYTYDRHAEEKAVELFAQNIMKAGVSFLDNPEETPFMPSWNRVISAIPEVLERFRETVEADQKEFAP